MYPNLSLSLVYLVPYYILDIFNNRSGLFFQVLFVSLYIKKALLNYPLNQYVLTFDFLTLVIMYAVKSNINEKITVQMLISTPSTLVFLPQSKTSGGELCVLGHST